MKIYKAIFLVLLVISVFSLNIQAQGDSTEEPKNPEESTNPDEETNPDEANNPKDPDEYEGTVNLEEDSLLPKDLSPVNAKTVAIMPFGLLNPPTEEGIKIARGIEILLEYYMDFYFQWTVTSSSFVMSALVDIELPAAPGLKEARILAQKLKVDYIIFGSVYLGKPDIILKGAWYDFKNNNLLSYVEQQSSVSMLLRLLTNFTRQLAYAPQMQFPRTEIEKTASEIQFCKYITTFLIYVDAYLAFIRNDVQAAEEALDIAIEHEPSFERAILFKAELTLMQSGIDEWEAYQQKVKKILSLLESLADANPYDFRLYWITGLLNLKSGEPSSSKAHNLFAKSFTIRKNWLAAYQDMIVETMPALMAVNKYYSNQENIYLEAKKVRKLFPGNPSAYFVLPKISYILGNIDYASGVLYRMMETYSDFINGLRLLAEILNRKEGPDEATTILINIMKYQPFDYSVAYQIFVTLIDAAFKGIDQDDDKKNISLDEIEKANKQEFPDNRKHSFFRRVKLGFDVKRFNEFDINKDNQLDKNEFMLLLSSFVKGPVIRTGPREARDETGISIIAEEIWHYALLCYAFEGISGAGFGDRGDMLNLIINSNGKILDKMFEAEKIFVEIASDNDLTDYNINNQLSNLVILWGLADKYKGDRKTALEAATKFNSKIAEINKSRPELLCKNWKCDILTFELYPNRHPAKRLAPLNLPKFDFTAAD